MAPISAHPILVFKKTEKKKPLPSSKLSHGHPTILGPKIKKDKEPLIRVTYGISCL